MDTVTVVIQATDSNAPVQIEDETEGSVMDALAENTMFQAAFAALVLFVLMGTLMIRDKAGAYGIRSGEWSEPLKFARTAD